MPPRARCLSFAFAVLALSAGRASAQTADTAAQRSVLSGAYNAAQAKAGEAVFTRICAQCHVTVQFSDANFQRAWAGRTARDLFELIRTQMPQDNPGGLRREEYAAVLAYIFQLNGYPPGESALPAADAALRHVRIDPKPGSTP
jgi:mono/diheme cytochrome c family protein